VCVCVCVYVVVGYLLWWIIYRESNFVRLVVCVSERVTNGEVWVEEGKKLLKNKVFPYANDGFSSTSLPLVRSGRDESDTFTQLPSTFAFSPVCSLSPSLSLALHVGRGW